MNNRAILKLVESNTSAAESVRNADSHTWSESVMRKPVLATCFTSALLFQAQLVNGLIPVVSPFVTSNDPLFYTQQMQCPAFPNTTVFATGEYARRLDELSEDYIIYSNYPLEYVQIFVFGMIHRAPSFDPMFHTVTIDNDDLLASTLSKIAGPSELLLLEGAPLTFKNPCSRMLDNSVPKVDSLICQGWEIEMLLQYAESLVLEYTKYREIVQGWSLLESISYRYLFNEPIALSQIKVIDELLQSLTADRNRGIVQGVENALAEEPKKRIYIRGGRLHFFRPDSLRPDFSDQMTGELREYFNRLESQGIPSAFFYPSRQNDVHAKVFAEDLGEKPRARPD